MSAKATHVKLFRLRERKKFMQVFAAGPRARPGSIARKRFCVKHFLARSVTRQQTGRANFSAKPMLCQALSTLSAQKTRGSLAPRPCDFVAWLMSFFEALQSFCEFFTVKRLKIVDFLARRPPPEFFYVFAQLRQKVVDTRSSTPYNIRIV